MFVSDEQANVVHLVDGAGDRLVGDIPIGRRPRGMVVSPDGRRLYVAVGKDDDIAVVDLSTDKVVDHLPSGPDPERFAVSPDGRDLYVANENDST